MTASHGPPSRAEIATERRNTTRVEAFSDGVIAIAITLLILEIRVPEVPEAEGASGLIRALGSLWPSMVAFGLSFIVIGIIWIWHHTLFRFIERADQALMVANVILLATISFIPFPTALLGRYIESPDQRPVAVAVYAASSLAMALGFNLVWRYARWRGLLVPNANPASVATIDRAFTYTPLIFVGTIVLAFVVPLVSLAVLLLMPLYYALARPSPQVAG